MRKFETWLIGASWVAMALLVALAAALEPAGAARACDDGSVHLAMGCASIAL
ncbi:MAG: hypothetical protein QOJ91_1963 [Sphingomonadales bacterium]|jgi:hypothetical protein|nr:hypothetical protein [Sphingomonadales bacterium]